MEATKIPTGFLFCTEGSRGMLETLSIGDYGKRHNIKADFLGFTDEINGVPNMPTMPLSEKWVIMVTFANAVKPIGLVLLDGNMPIAPGEVV